MKSNLLTSYEPGIILLTFITCLGGVLSGYHLGVISVALPSLTQEFELSDTQEESVAGVLFLGGIFGCWIGGYAVDFFGRKRAIIVTNFVYILGSIISCTKRNSFAQVLWGRGITGFAVSLSGISNVSYLTEMAPSNSVRGGIVSVNELGTSFGFLVAYFVGYFATINGETGNWRIMFGAPMILAILQGIFMTGMPESRVWLDLKHGNESNDLLDDHSRSSGITSSMEPDSKYRDYGQKTNFAIKATYNIDSDNTGNETEVGSRPSSHSLKDEDLGGTGHHEGKSTHPRQQAAHDNSEPALQSFFTPPPGISPAYYYQSIVIILFLAIAQQLCGHINILNFAPDIFAQAMGYNNAEEEPDLSQSLIPTLFLGSIKFIVTAWVIWEVDTGIGRRKLMILGVSLIALGLFLLICAFAGELDYSKMTTAQEVSTVLGVAFVVIGFASSFGPLTWLFASELFPASCRGRALGYSEVVTMASAYLVSYTFLSGQDLLGPAVPFALYFVSTLITLLFVIVAVPDTNVAQTSDSEDMTALENEMAKMWLWNEKKRTFQLPNTTELVASDANYNFRNAEYV